MNILSSRYPLILIGLLLLTCSLSAGAVSSLDMTQNGYAATVEGAYSPEAPLSLSAEIVTAENGFLDYGLAFSYQKDSGDSVNLQAGLVFTFTLIKQDTYMPVSLTVEPEFIYSDFITGALESYEGIGIRFSGSLLHVMRIAHRQFLSLGFIASFERISFSSEKDTLSPYTDSKLRIGTTLRYTIRDYPLNRGNSSEVRISVLFSDQWAPTVKLGYSFLRYKETYND